jgi:hypothetical protein
MYSQIAKETRALALINIETAKQASNKHGHTQSEKSLSSNQQRLRFHRQLLLCVQLAEWRREPLCAAFERAYTRGLEIRALFHEHNILILSSTFQRSHKLSRQKHRQARETFTNFSLTLFW